MNTIKTLLLCFVLSFSLYAGGFEINEHAAKAMAMGGAFTAVANDVSAIYFNPAGISKLKGFHLMAGTTLIAPKISFSGVYPSVTKYKVENQVFFPSHFYASYSASEDLTIGLGFTSPFGLSTKWDENWAGKYLAIETSLETFTITPVVSYQILPNLSIGAGLIYSFADVKLTRKSPQYPFVGDATIKLSGNDKSEFGYTFGLLYQPIERLSLGGSFHSQIKYKFKGTAETIGSPQIQAQLPQGDVEAGITTPLYFNIGAAYQLFDNLTLVAEYQYVHWSAYDTLKITFVNDPSKNVASPRLYDNSYIIRFGADYKMNESLSLQAGIYFDKIPVKAEFVNPSLPEADRTGFSIGLGYSIMPTLTVNLAYLYIYNKSLTVDNSKEYYMSGESPFNGTYNSDAQVGSISISYSF